MRRSQPGDTELRKLVDGIKTGKEWSDLFPGVATLQINSSGEGPSLAIRLTKKKGEASRLPPHNQFFLYSNFYLT